MKNKVITLIIGVFIGIIGSGYYNAWTTNTVQNDDDTPVMIWNDDWESIPGPGELVEVEIVDKDTIYFGPLGGRPF